MKKLMKKRENLKIKRDQRKKRRSISQGNVIILQHLILNQNISQKGFEMMEKDVIEKKILIQKIEKKVEVGVEAKVKLQKLAKIK